MRRSRGASCLPLVTPAVAASAVGGLRPRRTLVALLVPLLALFLFEAGVHSVHHLGDEAETHCAVASASSNLNAVGASSVEVSGPLETDAAARPLDPGPPPLRLDTPVQERAPPHLA